VNDAQAPTLGNASNDAAHAPIGSRRRIALATAAIALLASSGVAGFAATEHWLPAREIVVARGTGWVAFGSLLLSLLVTPLGRIAARGASILPVVRRALGMSAAWLALLHAFCSLPGTLAWNWTALWTWPHLRAGLTALGILLVLLATSFARIIAALRLRFWRELHRLAYLVPLLVLQHVLLSPFGSRTLALCVTASVYALAPLRWVVARNPRSV
jgi:DMSO/TMAO reductase YedYZ heme-binding membrane subunit